MTQNFFGRDPMVWWIGKVTSPKDGKWEDTLEKKHMDNGEEIYSHRCRVRILGYHDTDDLKDEELPLAHILLPSNTTTVGGRSQTVQYQGGEIVIGFFFDGEEAQQPAIFATLHRQDFQEVKENYEPNDEFSNSLATEIKESVGKNNYNDEKKNITHSYTGTSAGNKQVNENTNNEIDDEIFCETNEIAKMTTELKKFTQKLQLLEQLNESSTYLDPVYGGFVDMKKEIKFTASKIHNSMTGLVRRGRTWLIQESVGKFSEDLSKKVDRHTKLKVTNATSRLNKLIYCNIEKIADGLLDYIEGSLENMVGSILDVPICAIENFLGDMFGQVLNVLDNDLGGLFGQLNNLHGGGIALPSEVFTKGIQVANLITNVLECDGVTCPVEPTSFSNKYGVQKKIEDKMDGIIEKASLNKLINPLLDKIDNAIDAEPSKPDCNTNVLRCGPPKVDFIGGGGRGVTGSAIVNAIGRVIGVAIGGAGSGFTSPPLLTFVDSCGNGSAAGGYPRIKDGKIVDVVITEPGSGFLPNTTETTRDENGDLVVKEVIPDPNGNYDGEISYVTELDDVVVQNAGVGYNDDDTVTVDGAEVELVIQNGHVIDANVVNSGFGFTDLPKLQINTNNGVGAKLLPVLKFTKVDDAESNVEVTQEAVVTVISCIQK
mgnify:FL=1|tara:strand:+ start:171 stop:2141 length:1971 start_codon:yes stop_codon:yes gene_type:complete